jgi:ATP-dependent 26S proteasome regulatory subunit
VPFVHPEADQRREIWQLHLPAGHGIDGEFLDEVVQRCALTGGQIRNAAMHATLLAVDERYSPVRRLHLETAIRSEYRKAGATCPLDAGNLLSRPRGMAAFLDVMRT